MSNPVPVDLQIKIASWRQRSAEGTLTLEEMKEAIHHLRQGRMAAAQSASVAKKKAAAKAVPNADDLLGELGEM